MKKLVPVLTIVIPMLILSCSQEKKLIRKASNSVERSNFDEAISYYDQVLKKDSNSYFANAGKGVVLSEYIGRHQEAIPYLEKALRQHPEKTGMKLNYDLGKSYHFIGNYPRALYFYGVTAKYNKVGAPDYDMFLAKRVADCKYAIDHPQIAPPEEQFVKNVGTDINTTMPEYGAVYTHGKLIFTSKRKDDDKEKKNGLDGRYFDAMYVSYGSKDKFTSPRRFTEPDIHPNSNFSEPHESVVSASADGKTLFIFRAGQLYEADLNDSTKSAHKLSNDINFSYLQSHATLSSDGNTIIFASESDKGIGGLDLYKSVKKDGNWSSAELLTINTAYNEDAPFLAPDGTLFFASNGLPGYGGYDVYKTHVENGVWIMPVNLGQPINSPGDETYFTLLNGTSNGYYTSVRNGGYGDMDIYNVHYMSTDIPECTKQDSLLAINADKDGANEMAYTLSLQTPAGYQSNIRSYQWKVNGESLAQTSNSLPYTFNGQGTYTISVKAIAACDTCPALMALCSEKVMEIGTPVLANNDSLAKAQKDLAANNKKSKNKASNKAPDNSKDMSVSKEKLALSDAQLKDMNWNTSPAYFDLNKSEIRSDAQAMLNQNIDILKNNKNLVININGYADSRGSEAYNLGLSTRRANAVKKYMMDNGISKSRITEVHGYGETHLVNGCSDGVECTESEHQMNRRTEFKVISLVNTPADVTIN